MIKKNIIWKIPEPRTILNDLIISEIEIYEKIKSLPNKTSTGPDDIFSNSLLKRLNPAICTPLQILFQKTINNESIPSTWKIAKVIALFKADESYLAKKLQTNKFDKYSMQTK